MTIHGVGRRIRRTVGCAIAAGSAFIVVLPVPARAQGAIATRVAVIEAEDRRAPLPRDLAVLRSGTHSGDPLTARMAVRALGRLERPSLIPEIVPFLRSADPEIRAQAADAVAQAAQGLKRPQADTRTTAVRQTGGRRGAPSPLDTAMDALVARLKVETESQVRSALCESLGRLPFSDDRDVSDAQAAIRASLERDASIDSRLGAAKGLLALAAATRKTGSFDDESVTTLASLVAPRPHEEATAARVRRLAVEALTTARRLDPAVVTLAAGDSDPQVRRLAMKAAGAAELDAAVRTALVSGARDGSPMVRYEALRVLGTMPADGGCVAAIDATGDRDPHVSLLAFDILGACGWSTHAVDTLVHAAADGNALAAPRGWHVPAHALVSLASASPDAARTALPAIAASPNAFARAYAARAAGALGDEARLRQMASDADDNVREAAVSGLTKLAAHKADDIYIAELERPDHQLVRSAALALKGTPSSDTAVPALKAALQRFVAEGHDNSHDARTALAATLRDLGVAASDALPATGKAAAGPADDVREPVTLSSGELSRLQGTRARVTMRGLGAFDLALIAVEAPASASRFAKLASAGYYNGLTIHRIVPNFVIQGGSPGANEYSGDAMFMRDELGLWPHVRGAVGVSTRGRDTGDAQFFIDTVDNPRLDHEYTVFAQVLNGMDVVDAILEGDVIEKIEIVSGAQR